MEKSHLWVGVGRRNLSDLSVNYFIRTRFLLRLRPRRRCCFAIVLAESSSSCLLRLIKEKKSKEKKSVGRCKDKKGVSYVATLRSFVGRG